MRFLNKGKRGKTLLSVKVKKVEHRITWDKTNNSNKKIASGVYFITIVKEGRPEGLKAII
jgi:hypothetical protein